LRPTRQLSGPGAISGEPVEPSRVDFFNQRILLIWLLATLTASRGKRHAN
jgi:hypothetical protein